MKKYKIVATLSVYNELEKGNLKRFIKYNLPLVDDLIVYDDASTDGSYEYLKKFTSHIIKAKKNSYKKSVINKQSILTEALSLKPDFILWLDADEILTVKDRGELYEAMDYMKKHNIDGLSFHQINLWRSRSWARIDSLFDIGWFVRLWMVKPGMKFNISDLGIHHQQHPHTMKIIERYTKISVLHFGFADLKNISYKYFNYRRHGQRGYVELERFVDEEKLHLRKVPKKLFPKDLWIDDPKPKKLSYFSFMDKILKYKKRSKPKLKISVITPVFNREDYVEETLLSVLNQNYPDLEYIVINDGSTDNSLSILKKFRKRIKLIDQGNQGETTAVNKGLSIAKGDIVGIVNSDDPLLPGSLSEIAQYFEENPDILVGYPDWQIIDGSGKMVDKVRVHEHDYKYMFDSQHCYIGPGTFFTKKALGIAKKRSTKFKYVSDFEFFLRLGLYGRFDRIPLVLASFRVHEGSQSNYAKGIKMAQENVDLVTHIASLSHFPNTLKKDISKAYSSAFFLAGGKSVDLKSKIKYYSKSLISDPVNFSEKVKYELIKVKKKLSTFFLAAP